MQAYGWHYNAVQVAEHNRITPDEAYGLPYIRFLNDLSYIKAYNAHMKELNKNATR